MSIVRNPDGTFTKEYLASRIATRHRKKRRKAASANTNPNLMTGASWVAGTNTTLSIAGGKARATIGAGSNPRIFKQITGLINGATYYINGRMYIGTCGTSVRVRGSPTTDLPSAGMIFEVIDTVDHLFTNTSFVMVGTTLFIGIIGVSTATGQYSEIDDAFSLTSAPI
jgi:hypothetical protein